MKEVWHSQFPGAGTWKQGSRLLLDQGGIGGEPQYLDNNTKQQELYSSPTLWGMGNMIVSKDK